MLNRRQLALLHVAVKDRGLSDESYRSALAHLCGVTSAKELDNAGFDLMMGYLTWLGFAPAAAKGPNYGPREGMASFAQCELIRSLWHEYTRRAYAGETELNKWLLSKFRVSSLRFLTKDGAQGAITALLTMKRRAAGKPAAA